MGELADELGTLRVIQRALAARPRADALDEDSLLQDAIYRLTDIHQHLDRLSMGANDVPVNEADDDAYFSPSVPCASCAARRRELRDINQQLAVVYATAITAERALASQNADHDSEIALSLRASVCNPLFQQQLRLTAIAANSVVDSTSNTYSEEKEDYASDNGDDDSELPAASRTSRPENIRRSP